MSTTAQAAALVEAIEAALAARVDLARAMRREDTRSPRELAAAAKAEGGLRASEPALRATQDAQIAACQRAVDEATQAVASAMGPLPVASAPPAIPALKEKDTT